MQQSHTHPSFDPNFYKYTGPISDKAGTLTDLYNLWLRRRDHDGILSIYNSRMNYKRALTGSPQSSGLAHVFHSVSNKLYSARFWWYQSPLSLIPLYSEGPSPIKSVITWHDIAQNPSLTELCNRGTFLWRKAETAPYTAYALTDPGKRPKKIHDFDWLDLPSLRLKKQEHVAIIFDCFTEARLRQAASLNR